MNINDKVLLDEKANIIIDDEETKRELHRTRLLHRRGTLELNATLDLDENNDLGESTFNNNATETVSNFSCLKNAIVFLK